MVRRAAACVIRPVVAVLVTVALAPASARADGDPASDTLIAQSVFYPYSTSVPAVARRSLASAVAAAARAGAPVKVALIAHPSDLGSITSLWNEPQRYADFLHTEISYGHSVRLLVVMPSGDGAAGFAPKLAGAIQATAPAGDDSGAGLAYAATREVRRVTATARHGDDPRSPAAVGGQGRTVLLLALILAAILVSGAIVILRVLFPPAPAGPTRGRRRSGRGAGRTGRPRARSRRAG